MKLSTLRTIFGPQTPEFTLLTIAPFCDDMEKIGISRQISQKVMDLYIDLLYRFGRHISGDDYPNIRLAVAQGTLRV